MESLTTKPEKNTVSLVLFFLHNFFISIGTILVYVCATVLLLQNNPDLSLPLAYFLAAGGCMLAGKVYEHYEHHLALKKLIQNLMLVIVGLVILLSAGLHVLPPLVIAVALMVGYRTIYLLTSLEFWGLSALVFDVRQSRRIFGIIGSGDLPAKAIGALLAVLIHSSYSLYILLWVASGAFLLAYLMQSLTFRYTNVPDHHAVKRRISTTTHPALIDRLFGGSWLVFYLCMGLVFVSAAAIFIEYSFFFNVKHKYHDQDDVMQYIGYLLSLAFGAATLIKLLLSSRVIDRFGLRNVLIFLPLTTIVASLGLYFASFLTTEEVVLLNMFSGLYIFFEITRKTTYDPVFLVMFQPLFLHQRLKAHTLAKGFYEPLGMAITGLITLVAYFSHLHPAAGAFLFIAGFAIIALYFLIKAYGHYLLALKNALSKRFLSENDLVFQHNAESVILKSLGSQTPSDVLFALNWLATHQPDSLGEHYDALLHHPSDAVRQQTLQILARLGTPYDPTELYALAQREEAAANRPLYGLIASRQGTLPENLVHDFIDSDDLSLVQGIVIGGWHNEHLAARARAALRALTESNDLQSQQTALAIIEAVADPSYQPFVLRCLQSGSAVLVEKAISVAAVIPSPQLAEQLYSLTADRAFDKQAVLALLKSGVPGLAWIRKINESGQPHLIHFVAQGCERYRTSQTRQILLELLDSERLRTRTAALRALTRLDTPATSAADMGGYLQQEFDHIYQMLGGMNEAWGAAFESSLTFEINESIRRIFYLMMLQYDSRMVENAMLNVEHTSKEKRANAIEILDNIIPRNEYLALHALLEENTPEQKRTVLTKTVCRQVAPRPLLSYLLEGGVTKFSEWTLVQAIRATPEKQSALLVPYADHPDALLRKTFEEKAVEIDLPYPKNTTMHTHPTTGVVSPLEKVMVLKRSQLFENTPENVLAAIVPIIVEQSCELGEVLFEKGELGTCMYVIYSGTVEIFDGKTKLAQFGANDIFGELALLDAETRSASAVIAEDTLLFRIDQDDFYDLMEERSELLKSVLSILCKRIRRQNDRLRQAERLSA
ncbi:MFS transporter [Salmonirosea aquatica]|uniref:Cyclic nucleotide-binding domain-containing protein n=1 Tax=Salmonirosea aquatica TaxID=2654236 RepID=A0A7C9FT35_9BACT|nr:cyclic nucleotide-binding domain-containing protein [Cytophagaceae bacterium SJW1-29]